MLLECSKILTRSTNKYIHDNRSFLIKATNSLTIVFRHFRCVVSKSPLMQKLFHNSKHVIIFTLKNIEELPERQKSNGSFVVMVMPLADYMAHGASIPNANVKRLI